MIDREAIYSLREFQARSGLGEWATRQARRHGMRVIYLHGKAFVRGADFIDYVEGQAQQQAHSMEEVASR